MVLIHRIKYYYIYSNMNNGYIVYNKHKKFKEGHTHINNFNTAKYIAHLSLYKLKPKNNHLSNYLFESLIRVSDDEKYIEMIKKLQEEDNRKRQK